MWNQKKEMEEMTKRSSKTKCCIFAWLCELYQMRDLCCRLRKMCKLISHEHVKISQSHTKWSGKLLLLLLLHWFRTTMWNWFSSCEMVILLINSKLLNGEGPRRPFKWCQVSTWPWQINRNLNFSLKSLLTLLIVDFSRNSFSQ